MAIISGAAAVYFDDQRSDREARLENLRFVRERSSEDLIPRPFRGMDLREQNLSGLSLAGANLQNALLDQVEFYNTNLESSELAAAKIRGGKFGGTNLKEADLAHADLSDTDFRVSDMSGAILAFADMSGTTIVGVQMRDSLLMYTRFDGADLRYINHYEGLDMSRVCYNDATRWPIAYSIPKMDIENCRKSWPGSYGGGAEPTAGPPLPPR